MKGTFQEGENGNCKSLLWRGLGVPQHHCLILFVKVNQRTDPDSKGKIESISFGELWQSHTAKWSVGWEGVL